MSTTDPVIHAVADPAITSFINPSQLKKDIVIDPTNIGKAMEEQTALQSYYIEQSARARRQYERDKNRLEVLEAVLNRKHRAALLEENPKTTEAQVKSAVTTDSLWRAASLRLIDAQFELDMAKGAAHSFDSRKDMLLQIARDANREFRGSTAVGFAAAGLDGAKTRVMDALSRSAA
jgi:hypothetical protein